MFRPFWGPVFPYETHYLDFQASQIDSMGINRPTVPPKAREMEEGAAKNIDITLQGGRGSGFSYKWVFPKLGVPPNHPTIYFGVPLFLETPKWGYGVSKKWRKQ